MQKIYEIMKNNLVTFYCAAADYKCIIILQTAHVHTAQCKVCDHFYN